MSVLFSRACARVLSLSVPVQFARACTRSLSSLAAADVADAAGSRAAGAAVSTPGAGGVPSREAPLTFFPQMSVTLVRRVTARMPYNHFLFRVDPKYTKADIREYLTKVYGVDVARVTTSISLGKMRRAAGRRAKFYKLKDYKRALVVLRDSKTAIAAPQAPAPAPAEAKLI